MTDVSVAELPCEVLAGDWKRSGKVSYGEDWDYGVGRLSYFDVFEHVLNNSALTGGRTSRADYSVAAL